MDVIRELPEIFEELAQKKQQSFLTVKEYKDKGIPVIGAYCSYFPRELALAMGAIPIGLCSSSDETIEIAEKTIPKEICPLIKSSYGYAVSDRCPYFYFSDLVVGETTCDGKKKMYEMLAEFKEVYVMNLPNTQSEEALRLWTKEIIRFKEYLEEHFNLVITEEDLQKAVRLSNEQRRAMKRIYETMKLNPAPMTGKELFTVLYGSKYNLDFQNKIGDMNHLADEILKRYEEKEKTERQIRILITGCPMGGDTEKLIDIIEECGGTAVAFENCTGVKAIDRMIEEDSDDIYRAIAERYLGIGCSIMTPNHNRIELVGRMIDEYQVDGVIEMILTGCHSTAMESISISQFVNEEKHIPYLAVTTNYSQADRESLKVRIEAFVEMLS